MTSNEAAKRLQHQLVRWSGDEPFQVSGTGLQIRHQPQRADNAYLHRLYPGLGATEIAEMAAIVGQVIPSGLRDFYTFTNGARLFEGQISISGLVREFSRDPTKSTPISIEQDNLVFAGLRTNWHREGYFRIGGVSFLRQDEILCGPDDQIVVIHQETGDPLRTYASIFGCLDAFVGEMSQFWTSEGLFIGDWRIIDELLLGASGTA